MKNPMLNELKDSLKDSFADVAKTAAENIMPAAQKASDYLSSAVEKLEDAAAGVPEQEQADVSKPAEEKEPEYGWIFEQTILAIKKDGLKAIIEVLEWVFGKKTNVSMNGSLGVEMKPLVDLTERKKNGE